jgi:hypothetical protein
LHKCFIHKIISGGQTGADRAALDLAINLGIFHGGWCPKGRIAEDGKISKIYSLQETLSEDCNVRTTANVTDSDGTLIIIKNPPTQGTLFTIEEAKRLKKPYFILQLLDGYHLEEVIDWIKNNDIHEINIAGPRASQEPEIYNMVYMVLEKILRELRKWK